MKISDLLLEDATPSMTSVASIGHIEYTPSKSNISLYKTCDTTSKKYCVARITRRAFSGWHFNTTEHWNAMQLPHLGHIADIKSPIRGMKAHDEMIGDVLRKLGIRYDSLSKSDTASQIPLD